MSTSNSRDQSRRSSRSAALGKESSKSSAEGRAKARVTHAETGRRRPSQQVDATLHLASDRPSLKARTNSAPLVPTRKDGYAELDVLEIESSGHREDGKKAANSLADAQDEDEVAGVVGAMKSFQPFKTPELAHPLPDINIAIIGSSGVGKSTFMQKALDLPFPSDSQAVERKIGIDGSDYLLRLLEVDIDDVDIDDDDTVSWPETIEDKIMPQIDGAVTLYDVKDRGSLDNVPEMLNAIDKAGVPSLLISCKCDAPTEERAVDPLAVERSAKRDIKNLETCTVSKDLPESHKQGISLILQAIVASAADGEMKEPSLPRLRAQSTAVRPVSPRPPSERGHTRATSEYTGGLYKDPRRSQYDSNSTASQRPGPPSQGPRSEEEMHGSFFFEESASEASTESTIPEEDAASPVIANVQSNLFPAEEGATFEELVERLLAQPFSKADNKFAAIFLALYRKFAAPGELLEAIVQRFGDLGDNSRVCMIKTSSQLRILAILALWVGTYPGDFAYPKTKRRMRTFVSKLSDSKIFAAAAKEMCADLDITRLDDDTNWAYCDKDREREGAEPRASLSSTASTLIDDPAFVLADDLSLRNTWTNEDGTLADGETTRSTTSPSRPSSQILASVESAQQQAALLQPIPRQAVTKVQWRLLMEAPDDVIARELTRMDWVMFCSIRPRDLVRQVSLPKTQKAGCKNVVHVNRMIDHFNQLAFWVENYVLLRDKPKHRALMLEKFMRIARKLRELNNYNALGAIIAGIKSSALHRLAATRELIPPHMGKDWMKLEILMSPSKSHSAYRLAWENSSAERIPYLPLHRRDLVSAEEGNKTFIGDVREGRINWKKFEIMGEVVVSMQKAQGMPYKGLGAGRGHEQIKELVLDVKLVKDEDELFARSKQLEPTGTPAVGTTAKFKELFKR